MHKHFTYLLLFIAVAVSSCRVMPKPYSLNENVKQEVEGRLADSVMVKPGEIYAAGKFKRFLLGDHYRDTWTTTITVPVLNFDTEKGGLEIILSLLIDHDVPSLGHREICLSPEFKSVGVSVQPHNSKYNQNAVLDFAR